MTKKPKILIVDDDEDFLTSIEGLLNAWGTVDVKTANNGAAALRLINHVEPFQLIFSDYMMPEMDGLTFKEKLNEIDEARTIPFVVISGYGTPRLLDMAVSHGIEEWYDKPVETEVLANLLKKYLSI